MDSLRKHIREILEEATKKGALTLYHGTPTSKAFDGNGYIFLSSSKDFAKSYGDLLFECKVNVGKVFETWKPENIKKIYSAGFKLTDDYVTSSYGPEDDIAQFYDFDNDYYPTADSFINGPFFGSDTWEAIEHTPGVVDWILGENYDSIGILEGGIVNYYTAKQNILSKKLIAGKEPDLSKFNPETGEWEGGEPVMKEGHYTTWKKLRELGPLQYGENVEEGSPIDAFKGTESEIAAKIAKHLNLGKFAPLGSGTGGFAYYIPNNRVLKITKDKTEAVEAFKIKGKKLKHIANIYEVYELKGKYKGTYVIISELLDKSDDLDIAEDILFKFAKEVLDRYHQDAIFVSYFHGELKKKDIPKIVNQIYDWAWSDENQINPKDTEIAVWYFKGMISIIDELKEYNIHSTDWGNQNLGIKKNGDLAMYDLGYGDNELPKALSKIHLNQEGKLTADEYPDFFDGQNNPLFKNSAYPPVMNTNDKPLSETEISNEELHKKDLPYRFSHLFDDFVTEKTEAEIREIAPTIDLNQNPGMLMMNLETNYPSLFDNFADWLFNREKKKTTVGLGNV